MYHIVIFVPSSFEHITGNWLEMWGFIAEDSLAGDKVSQLYLLSIYFCFTTMTSVGYGDVLPVNDEERVYVILLECTGGFGECKGSVQG